MSELTGAIVEADGPDDWAALTVTIGGDGATRATTLLGGPFLLLLAGTSERVEVRLSSGLRIAAGHREKRRGRWADVGTDALAARLAGRLPGPHVEIDLELDGVRRGDRVELVVDPLPASTGDDSGYRGDVVEMRVFRARSIRRLGPRSHVPTRGSALGARESRVTAVLGGLWLVAAGLASWACCGDAVDVVAAAGAVSVACVATWLCAARAFGQAHGGASARHDSLPVFVVLATPSAGPETTELPDANNVTVLSLGLGLASVTALGGWWSESAGWTPPLVGMLLFGCALALSWRSLRSDRAARAVSALLDAPRRSNGEDGFRSIEGELGASISHVSERYLEERTAYTTRRARRREVLVERARIDAPAIVEVAGVSVHTRGAAFGRAVQDRRGGELRLRAEAGERALVAGTFESDSDELRVGGPEATLIFADPSGRPRATLRRARWLRRVVLVALATGPVYLAIRVWLG